MQYFNYARLIEKYSRTFTAVVPTDGFYDGRGRWVELEPEKVELKGAFISNGDRKLMRSDGTHHAKDGILHTLQPITFALDGAKVIIGEDVFSIESYTENAEFTGVYSYILRYVSAFQETTGDSGLTDALKDLEKRLDGVLSD